MQLGSTCKVKFKKPRKTSKKLSKSSQLLMKQLLSRTDNSLKDLLELERQNQRLKKHTTMPGPNGRKLDSMNSLMKDISKKSETLSTTLREHTMRTEICSQKWPCKKPEIKLLEKMSRNSKIREPKTLLMMRMNWLHSRVH